MCLVLQHGPREKKQPLFYRDAQKLGANSARHETIGPLISVKTSARSSEGKLTSRSRLFDHDVVHPDVTWPARAAVEQIVSPSQMSSLYLLQQHYRKLGTSEWLHQPVFEPLLERITQEFQAVQGSTESCHQVTNPQTTFPKKRVVFDEARCGKTNHPSGNQHSDQTNGRHDWILLQKLVCQMHQDVAVEYVKRLLRGGVKLKDHNLQVKAYNSMKDDAENLHRFFSGMVRDGRSNISDSVAS